MVFFAYLKDPYFIPNRAKKTYDFIKKKEKKNQLILNFMAATCGKTEMWHKK